MLIRLPRDNSCMACRKLSLRLAWILDGLRPLGMYGPPLLRKHKVGMSQVGAQVYTAFVGVNHSWPRWKALCPFPVTISGLKDFFRVRVSRAPSSTLRHLPSPADRARNHNLHILAKLQLHRPTRKADTVYSSRARPTPCAPTYSRLFVKIILCI